MISPSPRLSRSAVAAVSSVLISSGVLLAPIGASAAVLGPSTAAVVPFAEAEPGFGAAASKIESEHDPAGRLTWQRIFTDEGLLWSENWYVYDDAGRLAQMNVRLGPGYPLPSTGPLAGHRELTYRYDFDEAGRTIARTISAGLDSWEPVLLRD